MVTCCVFRRIKLSRSVLPFLRIHITGNAGSGKTTAAYRLSARLGIPAYSMDTIVWRPHWKKASPAERQIAETNLTSQSSWIIEGVSDHVRKAADLTIYLDLPRHQCMGRALRRALRYIRTQRPEFPRDCPEWKIIPTLAGIIWRFPKLVGQKVKQEAARAPEKYWVIRSDKDINDLLEMAGTKGCLLASSRRLQSTRAAAYPDRTTASF